MFRNFDAETLEREYSPDSRVPSEPLNVLVDQTCRAIEFLRSRHASARTVLVGHSSGAHLVAMAMCNAA